MATMIDSVQSEHDESLSVVPRSGGSPSALRVVKPDRITTRVMAEATQAQAQVQAQASAAAAIAASEHAAVASADRRERPAAPHLKMLAGMAGGVAEACALQPLDVAKTRLQLDVHGRYKGLVDCVGTIVRTEGLPSLYKGLSPFVTHLTLKYALRFGSFAWFKQLMGGADGRANASRDFMAGLAAGLTEAVVIVTPFEVVKTRLQQQVGWANLKYRGPVHCATTMVAEEGILSLWKGCVPTMIRQGSNQAFNFMAFAAINRYVWDKTEGDGTKLSASKVFATGLVAATIGPLFNSPVDIIKTRLQAQRTMPGEARKYTSVTGAIRTIVAEEGPRALWKGLVPRLMRLAPGQAITWTVVTHITSLLEQPAPQ